MLGFTNKGDGPSSRPLLVWTDEFGKLVTDNNGQRVSQVRLEISKECILDAGGLNESYKSFKELCAPRLVGLSSRNLHVWRVFYRVTRCLVCKSVHWVIYALVNF